MEESYAPSSIEPTLKYKRRALKATGLPLLALSFQTLGKSIYLSRLRRSPYRRCQTGIIYSDIGTSPLYTLNGIWPPSGPIPSEEDVIGGVSAIIWSLSLLPLFKYVSVSPSTGEQWLMH